MPPLSRFHRAGYWLRLARLLVAAIGFALLVLPVAAGMMFTLGLLYMPCQDDASPAAFGLTAEPVVVEVPGQGVRRGYFFPGDNRAAVILPPTLSGGRGSRLSVAALLNRHGYSVLTLESRRCAGAGPLTLGYAEVDDVAAALDYLRQRPEVDPHRIGIHGFSSGGATAVMAAARLPGIAAVVAEGHYGHFAAETLSFGRGGWPVRYFELLFAGSVRLTYYLVTGFSIDRLSPREVIGQIEPRPVLLIYGSREVSLVGARAQLSAAGPHTQLWIVPSAGHGDYLQVAPEEYPRRVLEFFNQALIEGD